MVHTLPLNTHRPWEGDGTIGDPDKRTFDNTIVAVQGMTSRIKKATTLNCSAGNNASLHARVAVIGISADHFHVSVDACARAVERAFGSAGNPVNLVQRGDVSIRARSSG